MRPQALIQVLLTRCARALCACCAVAAGPALGQVTIETVTLAPQVSAPADTLFVVVEQTGQRIALSPVKRAGDETVWLSDDMVNLTERQGLVTATQGLPSNLVSVDGALPHAWNSQTGPGHTSIIHRHYSSSAGAWIRGYVCEVSSVEPISVPIAGQIETAEQMRVSCSNAETEYENSFLRDRRGNMLQSRQWLGAQLGYVSLRHPAPSPTYQSHASGDER